MYLHNNTREKLFIMDLQAYINDTSIYYLFKPMHDNRTLVAL